MQAVAKFKVDLKTAKGPYRANRLDRLIEAYRTLGSIIPGEVPAGEIEKDAKEIITLDSANKAGLKKSTKAERPVKRRSRELRVAYCHDEFSHWAHFDQSLTSW